MARFEVFRITGRADAFVIDVQSDFLSHLASRVVIPLLPEGQVAAGISGLNPCFEIENKHFRLAPQLIFTAASRELRRRVTSLSEHQDEISRALDILLTGF